jgi:hypothetical protein
VNDPGNPVPRTGLPQRRRVSRVRLHDRHRLTQIGKRARAMHRPPGEHQTRLAQARQRADGMHTDKAEPSRHQDHLSDVN